MKPLTPAQLATALLETAFRDWLSNDAFYRRDKNGRASYWLKTTRQRAAWSKIAVTAFGNDCGPFADAAHTWRKRTDPIAHEKAIALRMIHRNLASLTPSLAMAREQATPQ